LIAIWRDGGAQPPALMRQRLPSNIGKEFRG
jgi:hypothetical protein